MTSGLQTAPPITHYSHHLTNEKVFELLTRQSPAPQHLLDVGAGEGYLVHLLAEHLRKQPAGNPPTVLRACDLFPQLFRVPGISCDPLEAGGPLPYPDQSFDAVTCLETIEHLEDQFQLVRELFRVTRPGGRVIVTTPNVLNLNSRLRYLHSGFLTLFDLLPLREAAPVHLAGHIHPLGFYYLAHMFLRAGFRAVRAHFDFQKRSAILFGLFLYPPMRVWHAGFRHHMRRKYPALYEENRPLLDQMNRWRMLTSRTLILEATK